jgi:hypothetical protein
MATLTLVNNTVAPILIEDVGFMVPVAGDTFTDPGHLRKLAVSDRLRVRITAGDITANDGVVNLTTAQAYTYLTSLWARAGYDDGVAPRRVAFGSTVVAAASTVTVATVVRLSNERLSAALFVTNNVAGLAFSQGLGIVVGGVRIFFQRTAVAAQFDVMIENSDPLLARTVDWSVIADRP